MKSKAFALLALCVIVGLSAVYWLGGRPRPVAEGGSLAETLQLPRTKHADRPADASRSGKRDDAFNPSSYQYRPMGGGTSVVAGAGIAYVQVPSTNRLAALSPPSITAFKPDLPKPPGHSWPSRPVSTRNTAGTSC